MSKRIKNIIDSLTGKSLTTEEASEIMEMVNLCVMSDYKHKTGDYTMFCMPVIEYSKLYSNDK